MFKKSKREGEMVEYYLSGQIKLKASFINNVPEGPLFEYHKTGIIKTKAMYKNGKQVYKKSYDENGLSF